MEEKKTIHQLFLDCWDMAKRYLFVYLDDDAWGNFADELNKTQEKYKAVDEATWHLYRDIALAIQKYKIAKDKKNGKG